MNTTYFLTAIVGMAVGYPPAGAPIRAEVCKEYVEVETDALMARIRRVGYVSGTERGSLFDRKTGAHDLGFGLHIMDFLLGPGWKDKGSYHRDRKVHGDIALHYIEGPQICTQARKLEPEIIRGKGYVAVRMSYRFTEGHNGYKPGSLWTQTIVFQPGKRYFLSSEEITSANDVDHLLYRIDMPGHLKHKGGDTFRQVYLSYAGLIPAKAFDKDFAPDEKFYYKADANKVPRRMIRAYQIDQKGKAGPWLAGMTLDPSLVYDAWCHQRGYICFIEELQARNVKKGQTIGAAYIVGYFDDVADMQKTFDQHAGVRALKLNKNGVELIRR